MSLSTEAGEFTPDVLPNYRDLLAKNTVGTVPEQYFEQHRADYGTEDLPVESYTSRTIHDLEVERLWRRTWQFACFEDDIPEVGDYLVYEIAGISIVVVRADTDRIAAFYNACLHRAAALCSGSGHTTEFRCRYHGWSYGLDGGLSRIPAQWDFPRTCPGADRIPSVGVATYEGFVFVNMDAEAPPLEEFLDPLPRYLGLYPFKGRRQRTAWVRKILPVNWKAAQEAFMEGYHLPSTHPELAGTVQGYEMQYDVLGDHVTRNVSALAAPNWLTGPDVSEEQLVSAYTESLGFPQLEIPPGQNARSVLAGAIRMMLQMMTGLDLSDKSDPEVLDSPLYYVFPNLVIWGGYAVPWVYRFRPNGNDPTSSVMEIFQLTVLPEGIRAPEHVPVHDLGDDPFTSAPELLWLAPVLDQDYANLAAQAVGLRSTPLPGLRFGQYQESLLRHHHHVLDRYLTRP